MRHDPAWLRLHDGHAHGVLADDPVHAHSGSEPSAGHTDQQNHHRPHSDAAQSHVDPARTDTCGSASLTRPNHPKAALPIDQRVGPAGSCTGGFRTQAPETLHKMRRSPLGLLTAACFGTCRLLVANLRGRPARDYNRCDTGMAFGRCVAMEDPVQLSRIDLHQDDCFNSDCY